MATRGDFGLPLAGILSGRLWGGSHGRRQEERIKESKCGMALRHLPSGFASVNAVWSFAAFLAVNLSVFCQSLGGVDSSGRAHAKRARRELFCVPARVLFRGRRLVLRLAPGHRRGSFLSAWC